MRDSQFTLSFDDDIFKEFSGNSLIEKIILKHVIGRRVLGEFNRMLKTEQNKLRKEEERAKRLDSTLDFLESCETRSDLEKIDDFKRLNRLYDYSPDCFTIKGSWIEKLTGQKPKYESLNLSPLIIEVKQEEDREVITQLLGSSHWTLADH